VNPPHHEHDFSETVFNYDSEDTPPPKVELYSRGPGEFSNPNILICHVSEFHRPGHQHPAAGTTRTARGQVSDLEPPQTNWHFHLTRSFTCRVTHGGTVTNYAWEPNM
uniref:Uncharacterized protein n=1 Tax=Neogobius melanostomus TaxID=47308 RepID=A0A8C6WM94_9GOBI